MAYDAGLVERVRDSLATLGRKTVREKNVFGGRGFMAVKSAFAIVFGDELIVKLAREDYESCLELSGVRPFAPGEERPMSTWVVVAAEVIADDPELGEWLERGLKGVRA